MARTKRSRTKREELAGQADPRAALDPAALLAASQPVLARLEEDLLARAKASPAVTRALEARYEAERKANRTAESLAGWTAALATQVAAAWLLSCVFVRTLEDRGLLKQARIAGPGAEDSQRQFFQLAPSLTERDYLLMVFRELAHHPAARDLFDAEHSLVWKLSRSAEAVKELLALFRAPSASEPAFRFGQPSTRFLGDLYQELSEEVRKRYALLQTPDFIEAFILDRTLEPAIQRFGLDDTTLIDPTCGSGHFLLGAFDRLFDHRLRAEPGVDPRVAAVKALDCVYGADINPYAVAIARFRLTLSFLEKARYRRLAEAPALPLHLVVADSLRINPQHAQQELWQAAGEGEAGRWLGDVFGVEDERAAKDVLGRQYAAVVGNPPYITVKDKAQRDMYRVMYPRSASREYSLSAPFCERLFQLARSRGYVGQITANSFMKREFGKKLIEEFLPTVNLGLIINTSGAFIPGHGTPTVLLFGTNEGMRGESVRTILAKRGEPSAPKIPAQGCVWSSIVSHCDDIGFDNEYISVVDTKRGKLSSHPWSLGGGGAVELKQLLEDRCDARLGDLVELIGSGAITREDDVFALPLGAARRWQLDESVVLPFGSGEAVRDWSFRHEMDILFPYTLSGTAPAQCLGRYFRLLWCYRTQLWQRQGKGFKTKRESGGEFYEYSMFYPDRHYAGLKIAFAEVATHNHFVLDRGGKVFKQTAPIIKLKNDATEDDHLILLAYLNSSVACFWLKQSCMNKGGSGIGRGIQDEAWENRYQFNGTNLAELPMFRVPIVVEAARRLDALARQRQSLGARRVLESFEGGSVADLGEHLRAEYEAERLVIEEMVSLQEEIDWMIYEAAGLIEHRPATVPRFMPPGLRSFELVLSDSTPQTQWFSRNRYKDPRNSIRASSVVEEQLYAIRDVAEIALLEQPEYKRRWVMRDPEAESSVVAREWLADSIERRFVQDKIVSRRMIVDDLLCRSDAQAIAALLGAPREMVQEAIVVNSVPFLAAARFTDDGLRKYSEWCQSWTSQRDEDLGGTAATLIPPKYEKLDYTDDVVWRLRGKLDVPGERFISYPGCESDNDGEPVYGWAGWDHLQRAQALATLYLKRKDGEGWTRERLTPMLAGLLELIPWVKQWHNEPSAEFNGLRMGDYYEQFLDGECRQHGLTHDDLRAWRPPKKTRGKARSTSKRDERDDGAETDADTGATAATGPAAAGDTGESAETAETAEASAPKPRKKPARARKKRAAADAAPAPEEGE